MYRHRAYAYIFTKPQWIKIFKNNTGHQTLVYFAEIFTIPVLYWSQSIKN